MRAFKIQSPCYRANGLNGTYYSIVFIDDNGNVVKGFGDHVSENSYGIKNICEVEGSSFSDEDRFVTTKEIQLSEEVFDAWVVKYNKSQELREEWFKIKDAKFGNIHDFLTKGSKAQLKENKVVYESWMNDNPCPKAVNYYDFLRLPNEN